MAKGRNNAIGMVSKVSGRGGGRNIAGNRSGKTKNLGVPDGRGRLSGTKLCPKTKRS